MSSIGELKNLINELYKNGVANTNREDIDKCISKLEEEVISLQAWLNNKEVEINGIKSAFTDSKNYLKKIINTVPDPIFVKNSEHRWVLLNDAFCRFMGCDKKELLGKTDYDFFPKHEADVFWAKDDAVLLSGIENANEEQFTNAKGKVYNIITKKSLFIESSGERFIVGSIRDISEIKDAKTSRRKYLNNMEFLSKTAMEFIELFPEGDIYQLIGDNLKNLAGNAFVAVTAYDHASKSLKAKYVGGLKQFTETFKAITGRKLFDFQFKIDEEGYKKLTSGKLEEAEQGFHQLTMGQVSKHLSKLVEALFGFKRFYGIGFFQKASLLGSATIIKRSKEGIDNPELIEAYMKQASVAIQKRHTEIILAEREEKYRQIFDNIQDVYYEITLDGTILEISPSVSNFSMYTREELLGASINELYNNIEERQPFLDKLRKQGKVQGYELKFRDKNGKILTSSTTAKLLLDEQGKPAKIVGAMIDISERKRINKELTKSRQMYEELVENIGEGVAIVNLEDKIEFANPAAERIFGVVKGELPGRNINDFTKLRKFIRISNTPKKFQSDRKRSIYEIQIQRPDNTKRVLLVTITSRYDINGIYIGNFLVFRDLTEKRKVNEALKKSEEKFRELFRNANDLVYTMDFNGNFTSINPIAEKILGYGFDELVNKNIGNYVTSRSYKKIKESIELKLKGLKNRTKYDVEAITKNGSKLFLEVNNIMHYRNGLPFEIFGIARDITERKKAEEKVKAALKEKEVLLKEVHHRVKNNLQVIISLINLQIDHKMPVEIQQKFVELQERIRSIALIHEDLYKSDDLSKIDFKAYTKALVSNLVIAYNVGVKIDFKIEVCDVQLDLETAIPCGMIINELVSNSLKYAFNGKDILSNINGQPLIHIGFKQNKKGKYLLSIKDNGSGFLPGENPSSGKNSLGLWLVRILVKDQLNGTFEIENNKGVAVTILF